VISYIRILATIACSLLTTNVGIAQEPVFQIPDPFAESPSTAAENAEFTEIDGDGSDTVQPAKRQGERIGMLDDFEQATKLSLLEQRPVLAVLGAEWCTWCRKLEGELETKDADAILKRWIVVKIDVDDSPDLADRLQANALPSLRILGRDQKVIAASEGYVPLVELSSWLDEHLAAADPAIQRVLYATGTLASNDLSQLGSFLGDSAVEVRTAAQERLFSSRGVAKGFVVDLLRNGNLSQQLSAVGLLQRWNAPIEGMDPWEPQSINAESLAPLLAWLGSSDAEIEATEMPGSESTLDASEVTQRIRDVIVADPANRQAAIAHALQSNSLVTRDALAAGVRQRLVDGDQLTDEERINLRELLYRLLAGPQVRLENSSLLTALGSLDASSHRQAAETLLKVLTSQDQALVDELSSDADPFVRESAIVRLQSIGALKDPQRIEKLLADTSPSVRTAVLRELAENPNDEAIETLIDYLERETDENLMVYATKTLGQLGTKGKAEDALIKLAGNDGWRVRAAALDAIAGRLNDNQDNYSFSSVSSVFSVEIESEGRVSAELAKVVLARTEDEDKFVAEKAIGLLPSILSTDSAPALMEYLQKNPSRLKEIDKDVSEYEREEIFQPLVDYAQKWLETEDSEQVRAAAEVLSKLAPTTLRSNLPQLLRSADRPTRIAGVRAFLSSLKQIRNEELEELKAAFVSGPGQPVARESWHTVPEAFLQLPKKSAIGVEAVATPSTDASSDLLAEFFGAAPGPTEPEEVAETERGETTESAEVDLAASFFGELPDSETSDESLPTSAVEESEQKRVCLPSGWLARWQTDDASLKKASWIIECQSLIEQRLQEQATTPEDPEVLVERHWLQLGLVACGEKIMVSQLLASERNADSDLDIQAFDIAAWLPEAERLQLVGSHEIDFSNPSAESLAILEAALEIDSFELGGWILERHAQLEPEQIETAQLANWLLKALLGTLHSGINDTFRGEELVASKEAFVHFVALRRWPTADPSLPERSDTIDWLEKQYRQYQQPKLRAAVLAALTYFDHKLATQCSVGLVMEARELDAAVEAALLISLSDQESLSCDRAVLFLEHELPEVRQHAVQRLSKTSWGYSSEMEQYAIVRHYEYSANYPGLWHVRRELPWATLQADKGSWESRVLLLGALQSAESADAPSLEEVTADHKDEASRAFIVAALAKANRTDAEAIAYYKEACEGLESPAIVYAMLRPLKGDEISQIRSAMRREYGSSALVTN
jgi:HEAT repeat protein/thiol-disulfide isomerase/thioredoxin